MHKLLITVGLTVLTSCVFSQYYYKDIISSKQLNADIAAYKEKKVRTIKLKSFEYDGEPAEGFFCEKKISRDFKTVELFTKSSGSATSLFTSVFNEKGSLSWSSDSSEISVTHNRYYYDAGNRISRIASSVKSSDDDFTNEILEEHIYEYGETDLPTGMWLIKNKRDSVKVLFLPDDQGNVSIEKDTKTGSKYYYYYDVKKRITDVVHANEYREKLVAVYLFEYDDAGQVTQMTTTEEGSNNYFVWRYMYDKGLRANERLYSKDRKLMGSIEYEYN